MTPLHQEDCMEICKSMLCHVGPKNHLLLMSWLTNFLQKLNIHPSTSKSMGWGRLVWILDVQGLQANWQALLWRKRPSWSLEEWGFPGFFLLGPIGALAPSSDIMEGVQGSPKETHLMLTHFVVNQKKPKNSKMAPNCPNNKELLVLISQGLLTKWAFTDRVIPKLCHGSGPETHATAN